MNEDQALQRLSTILSQPEFLAVQAGASLWDLLLAAVVRIVLQLLTALYVTVTRSATGDAGPVGYVMLFVAFLTVVALVVGLVRAVRLSVGGGWAEAAREAAVRRERADRLFQEAQFLASAGKYPEAIRALYLSALYSLEERAALRVQESLTNREHAERAARSLGEGVSQSFGSLVLRYDRVRYGHYPANEAVYAEIRDLVQQTRSAMQRAA